MKCIVCGKEVQELKHFDDNRPQDNCWDGGIVEMITAGYGSTHDCLSFLICICDGCLTEIKIPVSDHAHKEHNFPGIPNKYIPYGWYND